MGPGCKRGTLFAPYIGGLGLERLRILVGGFPSCDVFEGMCVVYLLMVYVNGLG